MRLSNDVYIFLCTNRNHIKEMNMFGLIWAAIIGLIVGALAKLIMPGKDPGGIIVTILIGVGGAILMTFIGHTLGFYRIGQSAGFFGALLGAVLLLWVYRMIAGRR